MRLVLKGGKGEGAEGKGWAGCWRRGRPGGRRGGGGRGAHGWNGVSVKGCGRARVWGGGVEEGWAAVKGGRGEGNGNEGEGRKGE